MKLFVCLAAAVCVSAQDRSALPAIDAPASIALMERLVNLNSGSFHAAGVARVADAVEAELRSLGFETRQISNAARDRGPHLAARMPGARAGKPLLLIGHMDTVFEPSSPFQRYTRDGSRATGPGVNDMKGGIAVMIGALRGLHRAGHLAAAPIEIYLTGDEEAAGHPIEEARRGLVEAGKRARAVLCFESGRSVNGRDYLSAARRGAQMWELRVKAAPGHSSRIFSEPIGHGAAYEMSRVVTEFHQKLREPNLTFSIGLMLAGTGIEAADGGDAKVTGKPNIVPGEALVRGDLRALTPEQVARVKDRMYAIAARSLAGTKSELRFVEGAYPPMAPTEGNRRLLARINEACRRWGVPEAVELDPMERGAGDAAFVSPYVDAVTGLGAIGSGSHAEGEWVDLDSLPRAIARALAAILELSR